MTVLEIILVSVLGGLVLVMVLYLLVFHTNKVNRIETFDVINVEAKQGAIVFFGDSLTDFYPIQDFFPTQMIYNRGIAGDTTNDLLKRVHNVIAIKPRKVFVQIGINDLGKGAKPEKIVSNIKKIYKKLHKEIEGVKIYGISLYPVSHHKIWLSPLIAGLRLNKDIKRTNKLLKKACKDMRVTYINMFDALVDNKGRLNKEYTLEGLHISGVGYGVISRVLDQYIKQ